MYLVDTNIVSEARRGTPQAVSWLRSVDPLSVHLSALTLGEIMRGIALKQKTDPRAAAHLAEWLRKLRHDHDDRILAVTDEIAVEWGRIAAVRPRGYVEAASSVNTRKAYASDWKHFSAWCRRSNLSPLPPHPQTVGLYITACASGSVERGAKPNSVSTIERRLSSISWNYAQRGLSLDRKDRHIATVMAGIRNSHARPPVQKEAVMATDIIAMLETIDRGTLRGMRDRAMLLIGYAGGLRRSEIVCLDLKADQTEDGRGWIEILDKGMLVTLRGKTGWREVEIGRGSSDNTCPVLALQTWIKYAKLAHGPLFRRVTGQGKAVGSDRLNDKEIARLVKRTAMAAGIRGDLAEIERWLKFSGHSLRAGLASSAEVDERYVQKQLGHASAEMTRRYQRRRDRFRVNLTKAAGL